MLRVEFRLFRFTFFNLEKENRKIKPVIHPFYSTKILEPNFVSIRNSFLNFVATGPQPTNVPFCFLLFFLFISFSYINGISNLQMLKTEIIRALSYDQISRIIWHVLMHRRRTNKQRTCLIKNLRYDAHIMLKREMLDRKKRLKHPYCIFAIWIDI